MAAPDNTLYNYDHGKDGQIAVGTVVSPWIDASGINKIIVQGLFTGGTTAVFVDQNREGPPDLTSGVALISSTDLVATVEGDNGAVINVAYPFCRVRIVQTVGSTTVAQLAVKGVS